MNAEYAKGFSFEALNGSTNRDFLASLTQEASHVGLYVWGLFRKDPSDGLVTTQADLLKAFKPRRAFVLRPALSPDKRHPKGQPGYVCTLEGDIFAFHAFRDSNDELLIFALDSVDPDGPAEEWVAGVAEAALRNLELADSPAYYQEWACNVQQTGLIKPQP